MCVRTYVRTFVDVDVPGPDDRAINRRAFKISLAHTTGALVANCNTGFLPAVTAATPSFRSILLRTAARGRKGRSAHISLPVRPGRPLRQPRRRPRPLGNLAPRAPPTASIHDYYVGNVTLALIRQRCSEGDLERRYLRG